MQQRNDAMYPINITEEVQPSYHAYDVFPRVRRLRAVSPNQRGSAVEDTLSRAGQGVLRNRSNPALKTFDDCILIDSRQTRAVGRGWY